MIAIILGIVGALLGAKTAQQRGGNRKDIAQYGIGFALAFFIVGMILTVILDRMLSSI